jgi:hypothetical protein
MQAAALLGISVSAVLFYTSPTTNNLFTESTDKPRRLTETDLGLFAYVVSKRDTGLPYECVFAYLGATEGKAECDAFEWEVPETEQEANTALVSFAALQAAQALMLDVHRWVQEAVPRERELQAKAISCNANWATRKVSWQHCGKGFWARLFGDAE